MGKASVDTLKGQGDSPTIDDASKYVSISDLNIYDFMDYAYHGSDGFRDGTYLVPHSREMFYDRRRELAFYKNFTRPIIRAMVEPIFTKEAPREVRVNGEAASEDHKFNLFIEDADNAGTHLQTLSEDIITTARLHSVTFVVVENFLTEEQPKTDEEAKESRIFPYIYNRKANQVVDSQWEVDKFGNIVEIMFKEECEKIIVKGKVKLEERFVKWTSMDAIFYKKDPNHDNMYIEIDRIEHGLGIVPVVSIYSVRRKKHTELLVDPSLYDIAKLNHTIFNKDSEIRELERSQGFSLLYLQGEPGNFTVGPNNVVFVPMAATIPPGFVSPEPAIQKNLMGNQKEIREDLFRIAEQSGVTGVQSAKSGVAMQWDFFAHESVLKKTSHLATAFEEKVSNIFKLYTKEEFDYIVHYPERFQPNDKLVEIKTLDNYLLMGMPPKATALAKEKATRMVFSEEDKDRVEEAIDEINETSNDEAESALQARLAAEEKAKAEDEERKTDEGEEEVS